MLQIPPAMRRQVKALKRDPRQLSSDLDQASVQAAFAEDHAKQSAFIYNSLEQLFPEGRSAWCLRHKRCCPVRPPREAQKGTVWNISGPCCTPWTSMGLRSGLGHPAVEAWNIWSWGLTDTTYGVITIENSEDMPEAVLESRLQKFPGQWLLLPIVTNILDHAGGLNQANIVSALGLSGCPCGAYFGTFGVGRQVRFV
eukprot:15009255-Alexandrium_andersonii.AAC.2